MAWEGIQGGAAAAWYGWGLGVLGQARDRVAVWVVQAIGTAARGQEHDLCRRIPRGYCRLVGGVGCGGQGIGGAGLWLRKTGGGRWC